MDVCPMHGDLDSGSNVRFFKTSGRSSVENTSVSFRSKSSITSDYALMGR